MAYTTIISTQTLADQIGNPDWVIIDCRFDLQQPEWGLAEYQQAHIPGAVYAHLDRDLSGPKGPHTGRHPLPDPADFKERLSNWGIDAGKQVVVYDTTGGGYCVRLWWMLRQLGHTAVAVLDGGFPLWTKQGRPVRSGMESNPRADFVGGEDFGDWLDADEVEQLRQDPQWRLIDARAPERFRGDVEPIDPVAGHIPGAINRFYGLNLTPEGTFRSPDELRAAFLDVLPAGNPACTIVYCGSGVTSIHHLLAMEIAGLNGARLYPGSWSEWSRNPDRPTAQGDAD